MFVFPRKKEDPLLMDDALPGLFAVYHESGWINKDTFLIWFKKFIEHSKLGTKMPVLLIFDGHNSHTKSLELDNLARANNDVLLCFPLHRLQPLDVSFMAPLSTFSKQETRKWLINHPGRCVTKDVFSEYLFAPSEKPLDNASELKQASCNEDVENQPSASSSKTMPTVESQQLPVCLITKTWGCVCNFFVEHPPCSSFTCSSVTFNISPAVVMMFPRETKSIIKRVSGKRRGKTAILTSPPYKAELETIERERSGLKNKRKIALFKKIDNPTPAKDKNNQEK
ncbi:hypothetical protein AVEN_168622-1 [Araneus ventricosus]|uniref:DDE-1 domain-containing protein n=1 Tax=Araneus ventricosus TaxID=182803 RepID=A0A4Y2T9T0_ARAVE|nr:hypothetical protein AVEN_199530-1 [Araneus ventricosus]GBN96159.1 hypothetical protein AVEN_168622-1 [Araneus ventricosus]